MSKKIKTILREAGYAGNSAPGLPSFKMAEHIDALQSEVERLKGERDHYASALWDSGASELVIAKKERDRLREALQGVSNELSHHIGSPHDNCWACSLQEIYLQPVLKQSPVQTVLGRSEGNPPFHHWDEVGADVWKCRNCKTRTDDPGGAAGDCVPQQSPETSQSEEKSDG